VVGGQELDRLLHGGKEGEKAPDSGTTLFAVIISFSYSVFTCP